MIPKAIFLIPLFRILRDPTIVGKDRSKHRFHGRVKNVGPLFVEDTIIGRAGTCNLSSITRTSTTCCDYVRRFNLAPSYDTYIRSTILR